MENRANTDLFKQEKDVNFGHYAFVLSLYKWKIFWITLLITAVTAGVLLATPSSYRAQATLLIESSQAKAVSIEEVYGLDSSRNEYLQTQFEILKSRELALKVIDRLDLGSHREFNKKGLLKRGKDSLRHWISQQDSEALRASQTASINGAGGFVDQATDFLLEELLPVEEVVSTSTRRSQLVEQFQSRLSVSPIPNTQLVKIAFYAEDPEFAAQVTNTMGEVYIESHLDARLVMAKKASDWLASRMEELLVSLRRSEERLQVYKEREGLIDIDGTIGIASLEINELTEQLTLQKKKRDESKSLYDLVRTSSNSGSGSLDGLSEISSHSLVQEVKRAEVEAARNVAELSKRYGPKHNKMIAAKAQLSEVRANMRSQIRKLLQGIEQEYRAAEANAIALQRQLDEAQVRYQKENRREAEYREYQREVESNRRIYETFLNRMKETGAVSDFDAAHARFTDKATAPLYPVKPKKKLIVATTLALSLMGLSMASLAHYSLSDKVTNGDQVESKLAHRLLGSVPYCKNVHKSPSNNYFSNDNPAFAEAWRTVRTALSLVHPKQRSRLTSVTSTVPGEGKSTCSLNLAMALSQLENTLLIEADLRKPVLGHMLQLPSYQPGLTNLVTGTHGLEDCIATVKGSALKVMVAGSQVNNPLELISSDALSKQILGLRDKFERIIIDTPPVDVVSDALLLAQITDSTLFVVRAGKARNELIQKSLSRLASAQAKVDGVILNAVTKEKGQDASYYDYYGGSKKQRS